MSGTIDTVTGSVKDIFRVMQIQSLLLVPIFLEGGYWGNLGLDDCKKKRRWTPVEIDLLKTFADLVGASITRERYMKRLADAQAIVENGTTLLYRMRAEPAMPLTYVSGNIARYGYTAAELLRAPTLYHSLIHPDDIAKCAGDQREFLAGKSDEAQHELRIRARDGSYAWFDCRVRSIRNETHDLIGIEGLLSEITGRKDAEAKLAYTNTVLTTALDSSPDGILVVDLNGRIVSFNRKFADMYGFSKEMMQAGEGERRLQTVKSQMKDEQGFLDRVRYLYEHPDVKSDDELELKDGRFIERHTAALHDAGKHYFGRIWFFRDITERKRADRKTARLARTDLLTGLANRALFLERLNTEFAAMKRGGDPFAVHYLDIDHFKDVNDTLGHSAGDELLKAVGKRLLGSVRDSDLVARLGGDEFAVLQADMGDVANAGTLAIKMRSALSQPYSVEGSEVHVTTSVGISFFTPETAGPVEMLAQADRALYRAKEEGRDQYRFHSAELDELVRERVDVGEELRLAIERGELEIYYQPQVAIASGKIVGMEGLVRWNHRTKGVLLPGSFLPVAEKAGVILALGRFVLDSACRQLKIWRDQGLGVPVMAINLSPSQLKSGRDFVADVSATLEKYGLSGADIEFDVSESALVETSRRYPEVFERLRKLGVGIAIDDFGSDYTTVGRLSAFRVRRFKIAPQFIQSVARNPADANIVRAMIALAQQLGIEVIAEGVETAEQRDFLLAAAITAEAQGFFYSKSLPAKEATDLLRRNESDKDADRRSDSPANSDRQIAVDAA